MEMSGSIMTSLQESAAMALSSIVNYAPSLIAATLVLLLGWLLARLARTAAKRLLDGLNGFLERVFRHGAVPGPRLSTGATAILGEAAFWLVVFLSLTIAAKVAELPAISSWLDQVVNFLPNLLVGVTLIVAGYFVSVVIGDQVENAAREAQSSQSALVGKISQGIVFVVVAIIGLDQMGVDVTFLVAIFAVAVGAVFVGFSIAFGLGAREYVSNLIGARSIRHHLSAGLMVRIGETEGALLEITQTQIALDTEDGRALVPARLAEETGVLIVSRDGSSGDGSHE